jgi:heme-degrading monooxygenase HmoA
LYPQRREGPVPMHFRVGRKTGFMIPGTADSGVRRGAEGGNMYVRMTTLTFRLERYDEGIRIFNESVIPAAKKQKGFRGFYVLADRQTARCVALTFWDDEAAAVANEENLYYQEQLVKFMPLFLSDPLREGFELVIEAH